MTNFWKLFIPLDNYLIEYYNNVAVVHLFPFLIKKKCHSVPFPAHYFSLFYCEKMCQNKFWLGPER